MFKNKTILTSYKPSRKVGVVWKLWTTLVGAMWHAEGAWRPSTHAPNSQSIMLSSNVTFRDVHHWPPLNSSYYLLKVHEWVIANCDISLNGGLDNRTSGWKIFRLEIGLCRRARNVGKYKVRVESVWHGSCLCFGYYQTMSFKQLRSVVSCSRNS